MEEHDTLVQTYTIGITLRLQNSIHLKHHISYGSGIFHPSSMPATQNTASQVYLPKLGFNRKIPKEILYGLTKYGGRGEKDLYTHLGIQQTKLFLEHLRNQDET